MKSPRFQPSQEQGGFPSGRGDPEELAPRNRCEGEWERSMFHMQRPAQSGRPEPGQGDMGLCHSAKLGRGEAGAVAGLESQGERPAPDCEARCRGCPTGASGALLCRTK